MRLRLCTGVRYSNMLWCQACYCIISDIYKFHFFVHINNLGNLLLETNAIIIPFSARRNKRAYSFGAHSRYCQFTLFDSSTSTSLALNNIW